MALDLAAWSRDFFGAVVALDADVIADHYAPRDDVLVFLEGPRWQTVGHDRIAAGWRALGASPMRLDAVEWIEGPFGEASGDLAYVAGTVELRYRIGDDPEPRSVRWRDTHVLHRDADDGRWRIVHEHVSGPTADPYGFGDWVGPPAASQLP